MRVNKQKRAPTSTATTKKYCSSNANFIELFSSSAICAHGRLTQNIVVNRYEKWYYVFFLGAWTLFLHFLVAIIACRLLMQLFVYIRPISKANEKEAAQHYSIRSFAFLFSSFQWEISLFSHFLCLARIRSIEIVIHHAFWSGTLWTCPVVRFYVY